MLGIPKACAAWIMRYVRIVFAMIRSASARKGIKSRASLSRENTISTLIFAWSQDFVEAAVSRRKYRDAPPRFNQEFRQFE